MLGNKLTLRYVSKNALSYQKEKQCYEGAIELNYLVSNSLIAQWHRHLNILFKYCNTNIEKWMRDNNKNKMEIYSGSTLLLVLCIRRLGP